MHKYFKRAAYLLAFLGCFSVGGTNPAAAATISYDSLAAFQAATSSTLQSTFESFSEGIKPSPIVDNGITFASGAVGADFLYTARPGGPADDFFNPHLSSTVLTADGNENFDITFGSLAPGAVGFNMYTNQFAPPVVTVFNTSDTLIGTFTLTQAPNTFGFFGVSSDQTIGRIHFLASGGGVQNTGVDDFRVGNFVPEPGTITLFGAGVAAITALWLKRKKPAR